MNYSIVLTLVVLLSQAVHSAPVVAEKSVDEVDSWLNEMEQALDKETPAGIQEFSEEKAFMGGPAVDKNGRPMNREGHVDLNENNEWWGEDQVSNQEVETDTEMGKVNNAPFQYQSDNSNFQNANPMEYSEESQTDDMSMEDPAFFQENQDSWEELPEEKENQDSWEELPEEGEQDFWEENKDGEQQQAADELKYYEQQGASDMEYQANKMEDLSDEFLRTKEQPWEEEDDEEDGEAWNKAEDKAWAKPWNRPKDKPWDEDDAKPWARPGDKPLDQLNDQPWKEPAKTEENWEEDEWQVERQDQELNEPANTEETWEGEQAERQGQEWNEAESQSWNEPGETWEEEEGWQAERQENELDNQPWDESARTNEAWKEEGQRWNEPEDRSWNGPARIDDHWEEEGWEAERQGQPLEESARTDETLKDEKEWQNDFEGERQMSPDNTQENEESWEEPNEQDFEDLPFDDEFDNAAEQSDDGLAEEGELQNYFDEDVAEEMSINLDNALEDEYGYEMGKKKQNNKPEGTRPPKVTRPLKVIENITDGEVTEKPTDKHECIQFLYIMAFTSGYKHAGANSLHQAEIYVNGKMYRTRLPDLPRDDYQSHKGDMWKMGLRYNFGVGGCVKPEDVQSIAIVEGSNDGWNIDSIITYFVYSKDYSQPATVDLDVYRWIDGNQKDFMKRFELTKMY